jgi:hypothetical protein
MRLNTFLRFLGVAFVFLVIPVFSAAQQSVTCEANNENRKYCGSSRETPRALGGGRLD